MDVSAGEKGKGPDKPLDPIVAVNSASEGSTGDEKTPIDEKHPNVQVGLATDDGAEKILEDHLNVTDSDLAEARSIAEGLSLEEVHKMMTTVLKIHDRDPNFPHIIMNKIHEFIETYPTIRENPEKHSEIIWEMKLEAALITNNSPYSEVRAVVDNKDEPSSPCGTIRAWTIGIFFSVVLAFVNQLFSIRQPSISIDSNVAQLLAFPLGKAWERWMPNAKIKVPFLKEPLELNPGPFNKKEHMLIAIMANTARSLPYTQYIVWTQVLPQYFNQSYAKSFGYQILIALSTNFIGYGLAGLTRRFIVYPAYCVWPASLVTIALNSALHDEINVPVPGPFKRIYRMSRYKFFMWTFGAMFVYFWFPNYLFEVLSYFSWMTWIAPQNHNLEILAGFRNGLGLFNPWPTFDWNVLLSFGIDPLMVPAFSTINLVFGMFLFAFPILGIYYSNTWNTSYLPINSNRVFDHNGKLYNVSRAIDSRGMYDHDKYMNYSAAYLGAANTIVYGAFFGVYAAAVTYVALFHRYEISVGARGVWRGWKRSFVAWRRWFAGVFGKVAPGVAVAIEPEAVEDDDGEYKDVHNRLMAAYPEGRSSSFLSESSYLLVLLIAAALGFAGISAFPTYTTPGVVPYGLLLALVFVIPVGVIKAMTGIEVTLNVLAEFIGGMWVEGNALAMNFFKSFGYVTCAHAVHFANDLKVAHYLKIPPRQTFAAQMGATLISTFVCTAVLAFQVTIPNVCQTNAPMRFLCPGPNTFFTAAVLWGTIGPLKVFGPKGQYGALLLGFPLGALTPLVFWLAAKRWPRNRYLRQLHPVAIWYGGINWAPYGFSYAWPAVPVAWFSWVWLRSRYLALWSKYNFVLSASFSAGIAIAGILMLFTVQWLQIEVNWWGNTRPYEGCEGTACTRFTLAKGERFFPWWNGNEVPAP